MIPEMLTFMQQVVIMMHHTVCALMCILIKALLTGMVVQLLFEVHAYFYVDKIELHLRVLATAAIYQKVSFTKLTLLLQNHMPCIQVLKLSQFSLYRTSAGHIVNIASNDVHRFEQVMQCNYRIIIYWGFFRW